MVNQIKPKISIVTVVYNGEKYLEQTLKSVISQTYDNIEYIIIDGQSQDNTLNIIKQYEEYISIWKSEKDYGIYDAMNKGIDLATGEFIWFLNAGDEIYDITTVENVFKDYNNEDVFYGVTQLIKENGPIKLATKVTQVPKVLTDKSFIHGMAVSHQSIIIKTKLIQKYNLDYTIVSDHDWIISALKKATYIKNTNSILSKYLLGGFSTQNSYKGWEEKLIIMKNQYGMSAYIINIFYFIQALLKKNIKKYILRRSL